MPLAPYSEDFALTSIRPAPMERLWRMYSRKLPLNNIINRYAVGDKEGAIEDYRRALQLRQSVEGAEQAAIGESMSELGFALVRNGRSREGLDLMERGLELMMTGPITGFVVRARRKLGGAYAMAGAPRRALGELAAAYQVAVDCGMADQVGAIDRLAARIALILPMLKARRPVR